MHDEPLSRRSFADWNLAYSGPSHFVERHVTRLLGDPPADERRRGAAWLITLMREFTQG